MAIKLNLEKKNNVATLLSKHELCDDLKLEIGNKMSDNEQVKKLSSVVKEQQKKIEQIDIVINEMKSIIEDEVSKEISKAVFFHTKAMQNRLDQFIFDIKIELKNKDILDLKILEQSKRKLFDE